MSRKGKVKMGLGDFLGSQAAAASQPVKGRILPSGPDPNRDPDERRGGGRRYDDDYEAPGSRSEGVDTWRRGGGPAGGGGGGMGERRGGGYDHERGGMAPEEGTWRSRAPPPRAGGGGGFGDRYGDRDGGGSRMGGGGGYDDRRGPGGGRDGGYDAPPAGERKRLQLQSRTAPPPMPPMAPKEPAEQAAPAPAPKPSGPRSNPFGAAQAVDTTQRDREIEAKAEAARQAALRRRDESIRSGKSQMGDPNPAESGIHETESTGGGDKEGDTPAEDQDQEQDRTAQENDDGGASEETAGPQGTAESSDKPSPPKSAGRWAKLRREGGGDERNSPPGGGFPRRDREEDRRGGGFGRDERSSYGRRSEGDSAAGAGGFGSRDPVQPPAPPAGNAFAKRFGSNFERDSERAYPRPSGGMSGGPGGFDRRDIDRRGGMGTGGDRFDRPDDDRPFTRRDGDYDRRGGGFDRRNGDFDRRDDGRGMGMGGGPGGFARRDDERRRGSGGGGGGGFDRREDGRGGSGMGMTSSRFSRAEEFPPRDGRPSGGNAGSASPPSSLSKMTIKDSKEPQAEQQQSSEPGPSQPESEADAETTQEQELEQKHAPEPEPEPELEDPLEMARSAAAEALATGKRGSELKDVIIAMEKKPTAGALLEAALKDIATPQDMKWAGDDELGAALVALSADKTDQQVGIIYAVVAKCHEMGFPKESGGAVVQTIFMGMYNCDLCEEEAFIDWKDDVDNTAEGRVKAVMQTTPWFVWLEQVDEEEDDE